MLQAMSDPLYLEGRRHQAICICKWPITEIGDSINDFFGLVSSKDEDNQKIHAEVRLNVKTQINCRSTYIVQYKSIIKSPIML